MRRRLLLTLVGSLGPLVLAAVWFEVLRSRAGAEEPLHAEEQPPALLFSHHIERFRDRQGRVTWQIEADQVELLASGDELARGLTHGQFFNQGQPEVHLRADLAQRDHRTGNIHARGNIALLSERGVQLRAESVYWFETEGRLVVPDLELLEWREPENPAATPVSVVTPRIFFWPREGRLLFPDELAGKHGQDTFRAAGASVMLETSRLRLEGPAAVDAYLALTDQPGAKPLQKRLQGRVEEGGAIAYNVRAGSLLVEGGATIAIPADRLTVRCAKAVYDGPERGIAELSGGVTIETADGTVSGRRATIETQRQRMIMPGPVELRLDGSNITAGRLVYYYETGRTRAEASGGVTVVTGETTVRAPTASIDLEAKVALLTGNVRLNHNAVAPDGEPLPVLVTCRRLRHAFGAAGRESTATGSLRLQTSEGDAQADRLVFDHDAEVLLLEGNVRFHGKNRETARAGRARYDIGARELVVEQAERASVFIELEP